MAALLVFWEECRERMKRMSGEVGVHRVRGCIGIEWKLQPAHRQGIIRTIPVPSSNHLLSVSTSRKQWKASDSPVFGPFPNGTAAGVFAICCHRCFPAASRGCYPYIKVNSWDVHKKGGVGLRRPGWPIHQVSHRSRRRQHRAEISQHRRYTDKYFNIQLNQYSHIFIHGEKEVLVI